MLQPGAARSSAATQACSSAPGGRQVRAGGRQAPPLRPELPQPLTVPQQKPARPRLPPSLRQIASQDCGQTGCESARQCRGQARHDGGERQQGAGPFTCGCRFEGTRVGGEKTAASAEAPDRRQLPSLQPRPQPSRWRASQRPSAPPLSQQPAPAESAAPRCAGLPARRGCALPGRGFPARRRQRRSKASPG